MKSKIIILVTVLLLVVSLEAQPAISEGEPPVTVPQAEEYFPFGININWGHITAGLAERQGLTEEQWIEVALDDIQAHHINTIHFNNLVYDPYLDIFVSLAEPRGIRIYPLSGGSPHIYPTWIEPIEERQRIVEEEMKPYYANLINRYRDSSVILAWGLQEEIPPENVPELEELTRYIDSLDPYHPAVVMYNNVASVEAAKDIIKPRIIPFDIYPFFSDPVDGPTTPSESLYYYENTLHQSYEIARGGDEAPLWVLAQGMAAYNGPKGKWSYRYPTYNEIRWQAWVAIVNGAKGILYWSYTSSPYDNPGGETIYGLVDRDGNPTEIWDAVGDLWSELEPLTKIVVDIDESDSSIISGVGEGIRARTFQRETGTDRYIIVVNSDAANSKASGVTLDSIQNIYDLTTLARVSPEQLANQMLLPGGGNIYLVGSENDFDYYVDNYSLSGPSVNYPPVLDPIGDKTIAEGEHLELTISATDPDGDSLDYFASNLPQGASFVSQTFSWTPTYTQAGAYTNVHFEVTDGSLTNTEDITIIVIETTPYIPGDANQDGVVNSIDITKVKRIIMGLDESTPGADANGDSSINAVDITQIELIIMGS